MNTTSSGIHHCEDNHVVFRCLLRWRARIQRPPFTCNKHNKIHWRYEVLDLQFVLCRGSTNTEFLFIRKTLWCFPACSCTPEAKWFVAFWVCSCLLCEHHILLLVSLSPHPFVHITMYLHSTKYWIRGVMRDRHVQWEWRRFAEAKRHLLNKPVCDSLWSQASGCKVWWQIFAFPKIFQKQLDLSQSN